MSYRERDTRAVNARKGIYWLTVKDITLVQLTVSWALLQDS